MMQLDEQDRRLIDELQGGFPICEAPFALVAARLGQQETELIDRIHRLLEAGVLSRFAPMYHAERLGGALVLAAMAVPEEEFDRIALLVNAFPEVSQNYARAHDLNMWFVIATETPDAVARVIADIERVTGLAVLPMPKLEEFYIGLRFEA